MFRKALLSSLAVAALGCSTGYAAAPLPVSDLAQTARYFEIIKLSSPQRLNEFLSAMPKGADLHSHIAGATYAEYMIYYGKGKGFCVDTNFEVSQPGTTCPYLSLDDLSSNTPSRNSAIDAWSMRNFDYSKGIGHDHFFATFAKFGKIVRPASPYSTYSLVLAEIMNRAGMQNTVYLELMDTFDGALAGDLGTSLGWDSDFESMYNKIMSSGRMPGIVNVVRQTLLDSTNGAAMAMFCGTPDALPGCTVTVNFLYQVLRAQPPERVFAQFVLGFEAAKQLKQVVGINLVQAEDKPVALRDYTLQMQMIQFLRQKYPGTKISLHAGELTPDVASPEDLSFHISSAVKVAGANRIGHGVDLIHETTYESLLPIMAANKIMVEINLISNQSILGVNKTNHPLPIYYNAGVPVALSTDDEGVLRTNLTAQYLKAVEDYGYLYDVLKNMSRNGLEYGFMPGYSLWAVNTPSKPYQTVNSNCANDYAARAAPGVVCRNFLNQNKKASLEWDLETRFWNFEGQVWRN